MKQYLELVNKIQTEGTTKPGARLGMPGSISLFGPQIEFDLADGFPLITTKEMYWKGVVTELIWFLRGDTNIKYLVDNGCNIWNEDAYNYYKKFCQQYNENTVVFEDFIEIIRRESVEGLEFVSRQQFGRRSEFYKFGDCGFQYGKVWRDWEGVSSELADNGGDCDVNLGVKIDQLLNIITQLKFNPESRRHLITAIDPAHDQDLALYWCHALFQFNARPLTDKERLKHVPQEVCYNNNYEDIFKNYNPPKYYLDCKLYQRSADVVLGVPFNIASYALLIEIVSRLVNMVPGKFIHSFGDVHIYDNHFDAVEEQLSREPLKLCNLQISSTTINPFTERSIEGSKKFVIEEYRNFVSNLLLELVPGDFTLQDYISHEKIKAKLSTGLK